VLSTIWRPSAFLYGNSVIFDLANFIALFMSRKCHMWVIFQSISIWLSHYQELYIIVYSCVYIYVSVYIYMYILIYT
jgi:hypothetical protein